MKKAWTFIAGVIVGFIGCFFVMRTPQTSAIQVRAIQSPPERKVEKRNSKETTQSVKLATSETYQEPVVSTPISVSQHAQMESSSEKKQHEIVLSENDVSELEAQWNDLPQLAEAAIEDRGWRIRRILPGSILSTSGLHEGDLVTKESIMALAESQGDDGLAVRVTHILNRISR